MKLFQIILPVFLIFFLTSCEQKKTLDCEKVLDKVPYFMSHDITEPHDSIQIDMGILRTCGSLDSIDGDLLKGPILGSTLVMLASDDKPVTYRSILNYINEYKKTEDYHKYREIMFISKTLMNKIASPGEFEKDKELFVKLQMSELEMEGFRLFLEEHSGNKMTYKQAFEEYRKTIPQPAEETTIKFNNFIDLEHALKTGRENKKPVLIYFTCYACINSKKMESTVLSDNSIKTLISENFSYFAAYLDDKTPDEKSKSTKGEVFIKLQSEVFKSNYQPYFYIVDGNGKVLSETSYTSDIEKFKTFLKKGLNKTDE